VTLFACAFDCAYKTGGILRNLTCIVCPIGCSLEVNDESQGTLPFDEENIDVKGNRCPRGAVYAIEEIRAPKRVVTATAQLNYGTRLSDETSGNKKLVIEQSIRRIPVKTTSPCLREKIPALLNDIYKLEISLPVNAGDVVIENWNNEGINVVATRTMNREQ